MNWDEGGGRYAQARGPAPRDPRSTRDIHLLNTWRSLYPLKSDCEAHRNKGKIRAQGIADITISQCLEPILRRTA